MSVAPAEEFITPGTVGDWLLFVAAYTPGATPTASDWKRVKGLQEISPPQIEKNMEDASEIDGQPWTSETSTGLSWKAEAVAKVPRSGMARDAGQEILRKAGRGVAESGQVWVRFLKAGTSPQTGEEGRADVQWVEQGGKKTDITTAELTLTGVGRVREVSVTDLGEATYLDD